ncbi:hypothetical protein Poli38472_009889 [Pythium oligandrum]|uniref:Protein kinase domain-containing protein n=1 Tax=Pythium oligandrum TaxID=41045 RepID=A0A8K1CGI3_PYTOL|nr:hypothetical protein Poli38472_009889 [Pythium oligandrum]|eukprot:TMW62396.1 hypothetical protein Poli38472_009889 [Pythium oligandrum]
MTKLQMLPTDSAQRLIAEAAARLRHDQENNNQQPVAMPTPRVVRSLPPRPITVSPRAADKSTERTPLLQPKDTRCPFRRSQSKPERPTSDMGEQAIAAESSQVHHSSNKKLMLLRKFSVAEEDVVICNRVRCGVDPEWFRERHGSSPRYQRSLSVEEARLVATRKRLQRQFSQGTKWMPMQGMKGVDEYEDDAVRSLPQKIPSPRKPTSLRIEVPEYDEEPEDNGPKYSKSRTQLTPREKAMHGRYLIRESFANGSYGKVCAGEAVASHEEVAVKIIPKQVLISPEEKQSVIREQVIHKSLNHPHIIKLIDVFEDEGAHYFILERADNGSLSAIMTYKGMPEDQCRNVFRQLLQALEYLHLNNIVHHDIKPHNILLHKGDAIKLCDFGASRAFNTDQSSLPFAGVFGTPGYIAPELLLGENAYGPAIDMFSAGILLFEMVFGYTPFYPPSACTYQQLEFPNNVTASPQVKHMISRLLDKDPIDRMTAAQALKHSWIRQKHSAPNSPTGTPVTSPRHASRRYDRRYST